MRVETFSPDREEFLRDESRRIGRADSISFPRNDADVREVLREMYEKNIPITVQGARTGLAGGAVPEGGHVLNLGRMDRILGLRRDSASGEYLLAAQPGVPLSDVREALEKSKFDTEGWDAESLKTLAALKLEPPHFFPPDLTEVTASVGGMAATNASGARSFHYGPTRPHIRGLRLALADGSGGWLRRGEQFASGRTFSLRFEGSVAIEGALPRYEMPDVKNAAGYYVHDNMDLLDLFIGSEGTLGVATELELALRPAPFFRWGFTSFFPDESAAIRYVRAVRGESVDDIEPAPVRPVSIEFFNHSALDLLREQKRSNPAFSGLPEIEPGFHTAVYVEFHGADEDEVGEHVMGAAETMVACGGDEDSTWSASEPAEIERLRNFRHATPEAVNLLIDQRRRKDPALTKLGTDMAVPDEKLPEVMDLYNRGLSESRLESVIFGHVGSNHLHVNILPNSLAEYEKGKALYLQWARRVIDMGGTVAAEHGIGKIKAPFLLEMYGPDGIGQMVALKKLFDPKWLLNRGSLFPMPEA
ncbi:FAD-binding oxidoreductase [bacterium]|nr:FAD-binding oxidoreductase [bacterium]